MPITCGAPQAKCFEFEIPFVFRTQPALTMTITLYAHSGKTVGLARAIKLMQELQEYLSFFYNLTLAHSAVRQPGPNPLKPAMLLEELGLDYKVKAIPFGPEGVKGADFLKLNPNGR